MRNSISKFQRRINKSDLRDLGQRGVSRGDLTFLSFLSQTLIISLEHERRIKIKRIERTEQIYIKCKNSNLTIFWKTNLNLP